MSVGTLEEIIDDNHAIVSTSVGSEHYVSILSFVDKDMLEPGCTVLLNHKVWPLLKQCEVTIINFKPELYFDANTFSQESGGKSCGKSHA